MSKKTPAIGVAVDSGDASHLGATGEPSQPTQRAASVDGAKSAGGTKGPRRLIQLEISEEAYQRLERLRVRTKKQSHADVVRDSLRVYEWLLEQIDNGFALQLTRGDFVKGVDLLL